VPLYQSRKKLNNLKAGQVLKVIADDPTTEPDFKAWMRTTGNEMIKFIKENDKLIFYIRKTEKK
jgi:tRNA 2-thiouridine synthesizing protein A